MATNRQSLVVLLVVWGSFVGGVACERKGPPGNPDTNELDVPDPAPILRVTCDAAIGGIALSEGLAEDTADYDQRLDALDLDALPNELSIAEIDGIQRAILAYALEVAPEDLTDTLRKDEVLQKGPMGEAVLGAFATDDADPLDFLFLRQGIHRFYACERQVPADLEGFKSAIFNFTEIESYLLEDSRPKAGTRRIYESHEAGVYVAETLEGDVVRETEIILSGTRADGMLDFWVYDENGAVSAASRFATNSGGTVQSASPYTCLFCHLEQGTFRFDVVFPDMD